MYADHFTFIHTIYIYKPQLVNRRRNEGKHTNNTCCVGYFISLAVCVALKVQQLMKCRYLAQTQTVVPL